MLKQIISFIILISQFATAFAESKNNENICRKEMKWISEQPLKKQEYAILNASREIFEKFAEINSQPNVTSEDQLWAYKILAIGNHILKEQKIDSPRINKITSEFSDSAIQLIKKPIEFDQFKLKIDSLIQQAIEIDKDLYAEKSTLLEEDRKQIEDAYKCVIVTAMQAASIKKSRN